MLIRPFVLIYNGCTEKTTREEQGGVYVGVWAQPTPPHIPVLLSQVTLFSVDSYNNKTDEVGPRSPLSIDRRV